MIRSLLLSPQGAISTNLPVEQFSQVLAQPDVLFWVDLSGESNGIYEPILEHVFKFHPLAIDDALDEKHIPKVDDWESYIYLVLRGVVVDPNQVLSIEIPELDIFLGRNYLVTYHKDPFPAIDTIWEDCQRDFRYINKGPTNLFYHIADEMVNQFLPAIEELDEIIDQIEDEIFENPKSDTLENIFTIKRSLLQLRRTLQPQKEVFNKLARGDFDLIADKDRVYFRDVYDHMLRLQEINENLRDLIGGALDTYLSVVNNRMNDIMKTLTIITTIFMPVSFLAGFFGMNFFQPVLQLDSWTGITTFIVILIIMILTPVGMFIWAKRRRWI